MKARRVSGFSLAELVVAMAMAMILMAVDTCSVASRKLFDSSYPSVGNVEANSSR